MVAAASAEFAPNQASDRLAVPALVALIWLGIAMGFVPEIAGKLQKGDFAFPLVVHVHAFAFVGWLVLLTAQVTLVQNGNFALHRRLGAAAAGLAAAMVALGLLVSFVVDRAAVGTPKEDTPFLSIQILDMLGFGTLAAAGLCLRRDAAAHKRLMLLATLCIVDAGFTRWWGASLERLLGKTFFGEWAAIFLGNTLLILSIGLYDLATRRRLHPAYVMGASWALVLEVLASWLYVAPWWKPVATRLIGY